MNAAEAIPELTPELVGDDIEVTLLLTTGDRDGTPFVTAYVDNNVGSGEHQARTFLSSYGDGDYTRLARIVRVRVPRSLLRERWTK